MPWFCSPVGLEISTPASATSPSIGVSPTSPSFHGHVSITFGKTVSREPRGPDTQAQFKKPRNSDGRGPGAGEPFDWRASGKSRLAQRHDGATLGLRCRALFGATARSEVLRILLVEDETRTLDAREISVEAAYTKRSISDALVSLASAGVVRATAVGNALQFRLARRAELEALLAPLPIRRTSQRAFCRVMAAILESRDAIRSASDRLAKIESARLTRTISADVQCIDPRSNPLSSNTPSLDAWVDWAIDQCRLQCGVSEKPSKRKSTRISSSV
jgi:hypothetical protein